MVRVKEWSPTSFGRWSAREVETGCVIRQPHLFVGRLLSTGLIRVNHLICPRPQSAPQRSLCPESLDKSIQKRLSHAENDCARWLKKEVFSGGCHFSSFAVIYLMNMDVDVHDRNFDRNVFSEGETWFDCSRKLLHRSILFPPVLYC